MSESSTGRSRTKERLSIIIRKVIVTAIVGVFAYFLTEKLLDDDGPWSIMASVFLGGVAFVTQFLVDVERRLDRFGAEQRKHRDELDATVHDAFERVSEATALHQLVADSKVPVADMASLIRATVSVDRDTPELVGHLALAELRRTSNFMSQLHRSGEAAYEGEDRDWLLKLAEYTDTSIKATSLTTVDGGYHGLTDGGLWQTDLGMRYLDGQAEAARRGVEIKRIFIIDIPDIDPTGPLRTICEQHRRMGVDVRVINPKNLADKGMNVNGFHDFIVFDDLLVYETTPASRTNLNAAPLILTTRLTVQQNKVADRVQRFDALWEVADQLN